MTRSVINVIACTAQQRSCPKIWIRLVIKMRVIIVICRPNKKKWNVYRRQIYHMINIYFGNQGSTLITNELWNVHFNRCLSYSIVYYLLWQMSIISSHGAWRGRCQYIAANYHFDNASFMGSDRWFQFTYDLLNIKATNCIFFAALNICFWQLYGLHVLLHRSYVAAILSVNGRAAFIESCPPIGL